MPGAVPLPLRGRGRMAVRRRVAGLDCLAQIPQSRFPGRPALVDVRARSRRRKRRLPLRIRSARRAGGWTLVALPPGPRTFGRTVRRSAGWHPLEPGSRRRRCRHFGRREHRLRFLRDARVLRADAFRGLWNDWRLRASHFSSAAGRWPLSVAVVCPWIDLLVSMDFFHRGAAVAGYARTRRPPGADGLVVCPQSQHGLPRLCRARAGVLFHSQTRRPAAA